jgi:hypothetical protein
MKARGLWRNDVCSSVLYIAEYIKVPCTPGHPHKKSPGTGKEGALA